MSTEPAELWWERKRAEGDAPLQEGEQTAAIPRLERAWVSPAGVVAELSIEVVGYSAFEEPAIDRIAALLRLVGDTASQVQMAGPVVGLLRQRSARKQDTGGTKKLVSRLSRLAGDQDWHRGDFVLDSELFTEPEAVSSKAQRLLSPLSAESLGVDPIAVRRDLAGYVKRLQALSGRADRGETTELRGLVDKIEEGLSADDLGDRLREWSTSLKDEVDAAVIAAVSELKAATELEDIDGEGARDED